MTGTDFFFVTIIAHHSSNSQTGLKRFKPEQEGGWRLWLHSLKVAQLLRSAACLHTNQSRSYLNLLVYLLSKQQNGYGAHQASFSVDTRVCLSCEWKVARA